MKSQILIDFIIECIPTNNDQVNGNSFGKTQESVWILHVDGASNAQGCGASLILTNIDGMVTEYALQFDFKASNNQTEYEVLIVGLKIAKDLDVKCLRIFIDSQLIIKQSRREYAARDPVLSRYLQRLISTIIS